MKRKNEKTAAPVDRVRARLTERGCPDAVIEGGLPGLVAQWEEFARGLAKGYKLGLDDYLNDLDMRQLIADVRPLAPANDALDKRLAAADKQARAATAVSEVCLWGSKNAARARYSPDANWWYFAVPKKAGADLLADLDDLR